MEDRDLSKLKGGIAGLKYLLDELRTSVGNRFDDVRKEYREIRQEQVTLGTRLGVIEARHSDLREDLREEVTTARHKLLTAQQAQHTLTSKSDPSMRAAKSIPPDKKPNESLETLKAIGPWIIAGISLIGTLVQALLRGEP